MRPLNLLLTFMFALGNCIEAQATAKEKAAKQELEKLQGEWKLVRCETDGTKLDIGAAKFTITKNSYTLQLRLGTDKGTFSIDPSEKLKRWEAQSRGSDEKVQAIYELNGNRMRFAYRMDNKRPTSIFGKRGSDEGQVLYVFERGDGKLEKADEQPRKDFPRIVVAPEKTPFRKEIKMAKADCWIIVLPNKMEVTVFAEKDRLGLGKAKSGLHCTWEREPHIKQGAVIYADRTREHELFVDEWQLSYVIDLDSSPQLNVTIIVTKREKKDK
jgi:uncharacterized protein (TIGR03067 family)